MNRLICHLIDTNLVGRYFRVISQYHDGRRFPVMIGSLAPHGPLQETMMGLGTPTFSLGARHRREYGQAIFRLVRLLRRHRVSILHAHCFDPTFVGLVAARLAGVPFMFTRHHTNHNLRLGKRWHTRIDAWCSRHADMVIAVSEATKRIMTDVEGAPSIRIATVYYGIDPLAQPCSEALKQLREDLGVGHRSVCVVPARLHEEKGQHVLFDAIGRLELTGPQPLVLLVGEGPHREVMQADVRRRGLDGVVRFLGQRSDIPELISLSSLVVLPSLAESFPFALLEAMSLGKPIVASTVGGIPELVGGAGVLVPPGDATALAEGIRRVLEEPRWAQMLGETGRQRLLGFSPQRMLRAQEALYERLCD